MHGVPSICLQQQQQQTKKLQKIQVGRWRGSDVSLIMFTIIIIYFCVERERFNPQHTRCWKKESRRKRMNKNEIAKKFLFQFYTQIVLIIARD
jgi:hypothetical protein